MAPKSRANVATIVIVGIMVCALASLFLASASSASTSKSTRAVAAAQPQEITTPTQIPKNGYVYLTFDDGPEPIWTPQVVDLLHRYGAVATFFVVGRYVDKHPDIVRLIYRYGNSVQNHTYDHHSLKNIPQPLFDYQVDRATQAIEAAIPEKPSCVRPPYDLYNGETMTRLSAKQLALMPYSIDPQDWREPGVDPIVGNVLQNLRDGSVILLHDGGGERSQTVGAVGRLLPEIKARGYGFRLLCRR